jgi:hypothetical protein
MHPSPVVEAEERWLRRAMLLELTVMVNQLEADGVDAGWRLLRGPWTSRPSGGSFHSKVVEEERRRHAGGTSSLTPVASVSFKIVL